MLDWLTGTARNGQASASEKDGLEEPPETPAPVFAVRAFRTAWFGTPQEARVKDVGGEQTGRPMPGKNTLTIDSAAATAVAKSNHQPLSRTDANAPRSAADDDEGLASPMKPTGIMLTPGTGRSRRKTVSFGSSVLDNEDKKLSRATKGGSHNESLGKSSDSGSFRDSSTTAGPSRTKLTKALYESRDHVQEESGKESKPPKQSHATVSGRSARALTGSEGDVTIDMNDPRSSSGRYWKSEFEAYQEQAERDMKKLKKYKNMAKSFARQKDSEARNLSLSLQNEREKVKEMEAEISELAASLAVARPGDTATASEQSELVAKLASQTALAVEYKRKIDQYQAALEEHDSSTSDHAIRNVSHRASPRTTQTLIETSNELKRARKQVQEVNELRAEMTELRGKVEAAERRAEKLEEENISLTRDLVRTKEKLKDMEKQRVGRDEKLQSIYGGRRDRIHADEPTTPQRKEGRPILEARLSTSTSDHIPKSKGPIVTVSLRGVNLPPERAAAAMARLEQRKADRKRLRMQGREDRTGV